MGVYLGGVGDVLFLTADAARKRVPRSRNDREGAAGEICRVIIDRAAMSVDDLAGFGCKGERDPSGSGSGVCCWIKEMEKMDGGENCYVGYHEQQQVR